MKNYESFIKTNHSRRFFLKGAGCALLLPHMASFSAEKAYENPHRMAFLHVPNGKIMNKWSPKGIGKSFELSQTLKPLSAFREDFQVISGLRNHHGFSNGDGGGDHARAQGSFLTGSHVLKSIKRIHCGISVDQVAAQKVGHHTYLPSLELSTKRGRLSGSCDVGYSCAYQFNLAWRNATEPMIPEASTAEAFNRTFLIANGANTKQSRNANAQKSILDFMNSSAKSLKKKLAKEDTEKLEQYFNSLREMERKAQKGKPQVLSSQLPRDFNKEAKSYQDKIEAHMDLMVLAWQVDATRICSMIVADEGSNQSFPEMGIDGGHHSISHHQKDPKKITQLEKIDRFYTSRLAYFIGKLKSTKTNGQSLLEQSMVLYGSGISDGNRHDHANLPILLAGHGNGKLTPGTHRIYKDKPLCNLFLNMLEAFGTPVAKFGDSTGKLAKI
jgi:hypothetical protein